MEGLDKIYRDEIRGIFKYESVGDGKYVDKLDVINRIYSSHFKHECWNIYKYKKNNIVFNFCFMYVFMPKEIEGILGCTK